MDKWLDMADEIRGRDPSSKTAKNSSCNHCGADAESMWLQDGNITCRICHTINDRFIDHSAEWLSPLLLGGDSSKKDATRCGPPVDDLMPHMSFGSQMSSGGATYEMSLMRKYQFWNSLSYGDRVLLKMFHEITMHSSLSKSIIEQAKTFYKKLAEVTSVRGSNRIGAVAACVYMACKKEDVPRSVKEIANAFSIAPSAVVRGCGLFEDKLGDQYDMTPSSAEDYVGRFAQALKLDRCKVVEIRTFLAGVDADKVGFSPTSLAAGAIFACCSKKLTKKAVAEACGVTTVTLAKCYRGLCPLSPAKGVPPLDPCSP